MLHKPVLLQETLESLHLRPGAVVVDGTLGSGGHTRAILQDIGREGRVIGIDQDPEAIERCRAISGQDPRLTLYRANFSTLDAVLKALKLEKVDAILLDLGFSSDQLEDPERGLSFERQGPLDMRLDPEGEQTAEELVHDLSQTQLEQLFREYGEERWAGRIARGIVEERERRPLKTTRDLAEVVEKSVPRAYSAPRGRRPSWARRHPATRIFQALRIAVNDELGTLQRTLPLAWQCLNEGGRFSVISFHSLEDRIVKLCFRDWVRTGQAVFIHKKPLVATREEIKENPRARSAKLRTVEKI